MSADPIVNEGFTSASFAELFMRTVVRHHGVPRELRVDGGSVPTSAAIKAIYEVYGVRLHEGTAYTHHAVDMIRLSVQFEFTSLDYPRITAKTQ